MADEASDFGRMLSLKSWGERPEAQNVAKNAAIDCGWGRLIFGQTFESPQVLAEALLEEREGRRDVALYVHEHHVVLSASPQALFLDPSHTFRLDLRARPAHEPQAPAGVSIRPARSEDEAEINRLYLARGMVPLTDGYCAPDGRPEAVRLLVAETAGGEGLAGVVMGVDHAVAIDDPDNGSSLWSLSVDPQSFVPGIGTALVMALVGHFREAGRDFMDLSVVYDNEHAIALYEKLGFIRVPVFCIKRKNAVNETLFVGPAPEEELNVYARIVIDEARRRGIFVEIEDAAAGLFRLSFGGRSIACRESLSDMTSAVALSRCDDKALTRRLLERADLRVPAQKTLADEDEAAAFLAEHRRVVVKPARGEQGRAVAVDLTDEDEARAAFRAARQVCDVVLGEEFVTGEDLRIIVIDGEVVAAALRRPATIRGDGEHSVRALIEKQSRRREAATGGESRIPLDEETERAVRAAGFSLDDVLEAEASLAVRKTANLHTGGTIHDVTADLHPVLAQAAIRGAEALDIPLVGFDFLVPDPGQSDYVVIEANERPGLANHEPQPTAERFIDFLFPQTKFTPETSTTR